MGGGDLTEPSVIIVVECLPPTNFTLSEQAGSPPLTPAFDARCRVLIPFACFITPNPFTARHADRGIIRVPLKSRFSTLLIMTSHVASRKTIVVWCVFGMVHSRVFTNIVSPLLFSLFHIPLYTTCNLRTTSTAHWHLTFIPQHQLITITTTPTTRCRPPPTL